MNNNDNLPPWHTSNCSGPGRNRDEWSARCKHWCNMLENAPEWDGYDLRTHYSCPECGFHYLYRTSNFSMGSDSDVTNYAVCCNPDCRHQWEEYS